jgi:CRP-like cAMP-binding protein
MKRTAATIPIPDQPTEPSSNPDASTIEAGSAMPEELYPLVSQQPFFKGLDPHQLQLLADSAMRMHFEAGQSIFEEGSPANRFYLILEGSVALESEVKDRGRITIQTLGPGDDLGWSWLFPPFYVHLSARALGPTKTIFFYGTRLREQCAEDHELGYQLMTRIAEVATQCLKATQLRLAECTDTRKLSSNP